MRSSWRGLPAHGTVQDTIKLWLRPGELLELEFEGIGALRNLMIREAG